LPYSNTMPYKDPEKQREAVRKSLAKYREKNREKLAAKAKDYHERKKAEVENKANELEKAEHMTKLLLQRLNLSDSDQQELKSLMDDKRFVEAKRLVSFFYSQQKEKERFEIQQFKHKLMEKYVCSDPKYLKLSQEGQYFYERSFLAFLEFLHSTHDLERLRQEEDEGILSHMDVYHKKEVNEIMTELDQFLNKYLEKRNSEVKKDEAFSRK
jgi:hypothetical protein